MSLSPRSTLRKESLGETLSAPCAKPAVDGFVEQDTEADGRGEFHLETKRLILRRWKESDFPVFADMCADPTVMRHLPPGVLDRDVAIARAAMYDGDFEQRRRNGQPYGIAAVEQKSDGTFLGFTGVHIHRWFPQDLEIGWRLARSAWGHGYALEAAQAIKKYAFESLAVPRLISVTMPENRRSISVMERLGLTIDHQDIREDIPIVVYSMTCEQFRLKTHGST